MIWQACNGSDQIKPIKGKLYRQVESQEQVATLEFVDTLAEQAVLEELLDHVKPPPPTGYESLHYLLYTPFRYPPLRWGSRFGKTHEPSLFYGGASLQATLAESSFYRLVFFTSMEGKPPKSNLRSTHSIFSINYATDQGIQLQNKPFDSYKEQLTHPQDYSMTQQLGAEMRKANIAGFEYLSARSEDDQTCVALYSPTALVGNSPNNIEAWLCETTEDGVMFKKVDSKKLYSFSTEQFLFNGELPHPA